jgi:hypothetical protein
MDYILSNKIRKGESEIRDNGDFIRTIDFTVTGPGSKEGIIFQYIIKDTYAIAINENGEEIILNTSDAISKFTNSNVKYMCDSYIEYFKVASDGNAIDGDKFGNGAISLYDEDGPILDREKNISKGIIIQTGVSVFLTKDAAKQFTDIDWNNNINSPANGLPYIAFNPELWDAIVSYRQSNILIQTINITWGYKNNAHGKCNDCYPPFISKKRKRSLTKKKRSSIGSLTKKKRSSMRSLSNNKNRHN